VEALINGTGLLLSWGYTGYDSTATTVEVGDGFDLAVGCWTWDGAEWQPVMSALIAAQVDLISLGCAAQIALGFTSSALGSPYTYPLDLTSQSNMQAAVIRMSMTAPPPPDTINYMCADADGVWLRRPHDATQIIQAALDGMAYIEAVLAKKDALVAQAGAASTVEDVQAVTWSYP
jgi:hypothetical protein